MFVFFLIVAVLVIGTVGSSLHLIAKRFSRASEQSPRGLSSAQRNVREVFFPDADLSSEEQAIRRERRQRADAIRQAYDNANLVASAIRRAGKMNQPYRWDQ